jgi:hypothetical protein
VHNNRDEANDNENFGEIEFLHQEGKTNQDVGEYPCNRFHYELSARQFVGES